MHDALFQDIQKKVSRYIDEQLAKKDAELLTLQHENKQLRAELTKLRQQNDALRKQLQPTVVTEPMSIQTQEQAEHALQLITSAHETEALRLTTFLQLYRWNMKHLHYSMDVLLALWLRFVQSDASLPSVTRELTHLHTQFTSVSAHSYEAFVALIAHYAQHEPSYFEMVTDVFYKQSKKAPSPFATFALVTMYAYNEPHDAYRGEPLYDALWQGDVDTVKRNISPIAHVLPLLPQTRILQKLTKRKKAALPKPSDMNWDAFITHVTNGKFERETVLPTFLQLVVENKKTSAYTKDFLRSIWKRLFTHYNVAYDEAIKDVKLHEYFIEHDGQGVFMLMRLYNEHDAKAYMRSLLDAVMKQVITNSAYKPLDVPILLAMYYSKLAKRYVVNDKILHYYTHDATERARKMLRGFQQFEQAPSTETYEAAYSEVQMVDVYLEQIGVSRKQFGSRVFTPFYEATNTVIGS